MWRYLRYALPMLVLLILVALFARGLFLDPTVVPSPLIGKAAPAFTLPLLADAKQTSARQNVPGKGFPVQRLG